LAYPQKYWTEEDLRNQNLKGLRRCGPQDKNELRNGRLFKLSFR
jgi:hypothetical protein